MGLKILYFEYLKYYFRPLRTYESRCCGLHPAYTTFERPNASLTQSRFRVGDLKRNSHRGGRSRSVVRLSGLRALFSHKRSKPHCFQLRIRDPLFRKPVARPAAWDALKYIRNSRIGTGAAIQEYARIWFQTSGNESLLLLPAPFPIPRSGSKYEQRR